METSNTKAKPHGVYKNGRLMHVCTTIVGFPVHLQTKDGSIWEGIFNTFSPEFTICLDIAVKIDPKSNDGKDCLYAALKSGSKAQTKAFFDVKDIVRISVVDIDINYAAKDTEKLTTDADISGFDPNKSTGGLKQLESWQDDDEENSLSANNESLFSLDDVASNKNNKSNNSQNATSGWDPQKMFDYNERVHKVNSTYDEDLQDYTIALPKHNSKEWRKKQERAAAIAKEIETNAKSQSRLAKEDGSDCEEEKFSAVIRPTNQKNQNQSPQHNSNKSHREIPQQHHQQQQPQPQQHSQQQQHQPQQRPQQQQNPLHHPQQQQQHAQSHQQHPNTQQHQQNPQNPQQHLQQQHQQHNQQPHQQHNPQPHQQHNPQPQPQNNPQPQPQHNPQPQSQQHPPPPQPQQHTHQHHQPHQQQQSPQQQTQLQQPHHDQQPQQQQQSHQQPRPTRMNAMQNGHKGYRTRFDRSRMDSLKDFGKQLIIDSSTSRATEPESKVETQADTSYSSNSSSSQTKDSQSEIAKKSKLNPNAKEFVFKPKPPTSIQGAQTNGANQAPVGTTSVMDPANSSPMSYYQQVPIFSQVLSPQQQHHAAQFMPNHMHFQSQIHYMPQPVAPHFTQQMSPRYIRGNFQNYHHRGGEHHNNVRAAYPQASMVAPTSTGQQYVPSPSGAPHPINAYPGSPQQPMLYSGPPQSMYPMVQAASFPQHMPHVPNPPPYDGNTVYMPSQNYIVNP